MKQSLIKDSVIKQVLEAFNCTGLTDEMTAAAQALYDAYFFAPKLAEDYEIAKIFNFPTHQVLARRYNDKEVYFISLYATHQGVSVEKTCSYQEEDVRDRNWQKMHSETAAAFLEGFLKFYGTYDNQPLENHGDSAAQSPEGTGPDA